MERNLIVYRDPQELADCFSDLLMSRIGQSGEGRYHLTISGGATPQILFSALASKYADSELWQKTHFWWVDERMVPPGDPDSNFGAAHRLLFSKIRIPAENIHRIRGENDPYQEAEDYALQIEAALPARNGRPLFNLVILGLGEDGHTASIFPDQMELLTSTGICEVAHHPLTRQSRVTLTGTQINAAARICFLITGANKSERLSEIWLEGEKAKLLPAAHIKPENGELLWYTDHYAANFPI